MTDEWEVRITLAVEPPPDEGTVQRIGTTQPVPWSGVGLAEGVQGITRLALNFVSTPATPAEAVAQAFDSVESADIFLEAIQNRELVKDLDIPD